MISVIIPVYNVRDYIADCIDSLKGQSCKDMEVIIVDDCGQDDSIAITHQLLDDYEGFPTLWIRHEHNRGLSAARNTGLEAARGEYVFFLDSDDYLSTDCLELQLKAIQKHDADIVVGGIEMLGDGGYVPCLNIYKDTLEGKEIVAAYLGGSYYMMAWNKLVRRSFLLDNHISFVEGLIHEDEPWSFEVACVARKMAFVSEKTYIYRIRENSIQTDKVFTKHYVAYRTLYQIIADTAKRHDISDDYNFVHWLEVRLALLFGQTVASGTSAQRHEIYGVIRNLTTTRKFDKTHLHIFFPRFIGYYLYKRFFKPLLV